jgi:hypothetical protein
MMVEDGRRLLISNLDLRYVTSNVGNLLNDPGGAPQGDTVLRNYSIDGVELFRLFPAARSSLRLSTAIRLSASFPYFSPASSLPVWPPRRVVDAGYYDNYGTAIAASWLHSASNEEWLDANASRIVLIQVRASSSEAERRLQVIPENVPAPLWRGWLAELAAPPEGLAAMREASMSYRNDHQLKVLSGYHNTRKDDAIGTFPHIERRFTVVNFELSLERREEVALNWFLSQAEKKRLLYCAGWSVEKDSFCPPDPQIQQTQAGLGQQGAVRKQIDQAIQELIRWWEKDKG